MGNHVLIGRFKSFSSRHFRFVTFFDTCYRCDPGSLGTRFDILGWLVFVTFACFAFLTLGAFGTTTTFDCDFFIVICFGFVMLCCATIGTASHCANITGFFRLGTSTVGQIIQSAFRHTLLSILCSLFHGFGTVAIFVQVQEVGLGSFHCNDFAWHALCKTLQSLNQLWAGAIHNITICARFTAQVIQVLMINLH